MATTSKIRDDRYSTGTRSDNRMFQHANREFAQELGLMAELGTNPDIASLVEKLMEAIREESRAHAAAIVRPRLPNWVPTLMIGISVSLFTLTTGGLITYGALQNRVANLENAHPETLSALAAEVHSMRQGIDELQRRFNDLTDQAARDRDRKGQQ